MACRGTGRVISNLGGTPSEVACPWCDGTGTRVAGIDAQARWQRDVGATDDSDAGAMGERGAGATDTGVAGAEGESGAGATDAGGAGAEGESGAGPADAGGAGRAARGADAEQTGSS
jgi:hypothetical protein